VDAPTVGLGSREELPAAYRTWTPSRRP